MKSTKEPESYCSTKTFLIAMVMYAASSWCSLSLGEKYCCHSHFPLLVLQRSHLGRHQAPHLALSSHPEVATADELLSFVDAMPLFVQ